MSSHVPLTVCALRVPIRLVVHQVARSSSRSMAAAGGAAGTQRSVALTHKSHFEQVCLLVAWLSRRRRRRWVYGGRSICSSGGEWRCTHAEQSREHWPDEQMCGANDSAGSGSSRMVAGFELLFDELRVVVVVVVVVVQGGLLFSCLGRSGNWYQVRISSIPI